MKVNYGFVLYILHPTTLYRCVMIHDHDTMEHLSNSIIFILIWIFIISPATAHYCVWGLCESWEYCCDDNICCSNNDYNTWITVIIIAGTVIAMILTGTCLYYNLRRIYIYLQRRYYGVNSMSMPSEFESEEKSIKV